MWWSFSIRLFFTDQLPMKYPGIIRPLAASTFVASHNLMWQGRETGMCDKGLGWEGLRNLSLSAQNASPAEGDQSWGEGQSNNHIFSRKQGLETTPDGQRRKIFFFFLLKLRVKRNYSSCQRFCAFGGSLGCWGAAQQGNVFRIS